MDYNTSFATSIITRYGDKGRYWLSQLHHTIQACAYTWNLTDITPIAEQTYNYVLFAKQHNKDVVLKLRIDVPLFELEVAYLRNYRGPECVTLLDYDTSLGALLLERIIPGTPLTSLVINGYDEQATTIGMQLLQCIQQQTYSDNFLTLETILPHFDREFPGLEPFIQKAVVLRKTLLTRSRKKVVLHGDFHHGNILDAGDTTWRVIDPQGLVGDRLYDAAVFIRNPLSTLIQHADAKNVIAQRIRLCAQLLDEDVQHVYEWTYLQTITSAYWSAEDGLATDKHVQFLMILESIV